MVPFKVLEIRKLAKIQRSVHSPVIEARLGEENTETQEFSLAFLSSGDPVRRLTAKDMECADRQIGIPKKGKIGDDSV